MKVRDIKSQVQIDELFTTIQRTATATIQGTEVADFQSKMFVVKVGAHTADDLTVTFQHRDAAEAWADIADTDLDFSGQAVSSNDIAIVTGLADSNIYVGYTGDKEDIGAVITDGGTGDAVVGVTVVKGDPEREPIN